MEADAHVYIYMFNVARYDILFREGDVDEMQAGRGGTLPAS